MITITLTGENWADIANQVKELSSLTSIDVIPKVTLNPSIQPIAPKVPKQATLPAQAPTCSHGPMTWGSGTTKAGKPYAGYYCPGKIISEQCPTVYPSQLKTSIPADKNNQYNENF